jgi:hypothetical protein
VILFLLIQCELPGPRPGACAGTPGGLRTSWPEHTLTTVYGHFQYALFHVARRDATATLPLAETVVKLAREHGMPLYCAYGEFLHPWARWHLGDRKGGLAAMRAGIAACHQMDNALYMTLFACEHRSRRRSDRTHRPALV